MFGNIHIDSEVEVCRKDGEVLRAKVKWKGNIVNRVGEWIGVELFQPVGNHDGFLNRRRYYQCKQYHGLFVRPSQIRFVQSKPRYTQKVKKYKTVSNQSRVDESLFLRGNLEPSKQKADKKVIALTTSTYDELMKVVKDTSSFADLNNVKSYRKSHSVGGCLTPAKQDTPKGGLSSTNVEISPRYLRKSDPSYNYFLTSCQQEETFRNPSSIPIIGRTPAHCNSTEKFYRSKSISRLSLNKTL